MNVTYRQTDKQTDRQTTERWHRSQYTKSRASDVAWKANNAKQNYRGGSVASYDTRPGNETSLFYNDPIPCRG